MRQVIVNLLENAFHATEEELRPGERGVVKISTVATDETVQVCVEDSGPGIADVDLERIFEPLFSTRSFGIGLGLPLVKRIIEQHDGHIEVRSRGHDGTKFIITLKRVAPLHALHDVNERPSAFG